MTTKILIITAVLGVATAGAAHAQSIGSGQSNNASVRSQLNATITDVNHSVSVTSAATSNSVTIDGGTAVSLNNNQNAWGGAASQLNATIGDVSKDVSATSAAIANSATIKTSVGPAIMSMSTCPNTNRFAVAT